MKAEPRTRKYAKALRRELTDAERILWSRLKGRRLGGWQFRVQHPVGPYIADFACVRLKLIIEVDGETHSTDAELAHDARRADFLQGQGWSVLRFWNHEIRGHLDGVLSAICEVLPPREDVPPPSR